MIAFATGGGFWVSAMFLLMLVAFLWVTNPRHRRTRRILAPVAGVLLGVAIRLGLKD